MATEPCILNDKQAAWFNGISLRANEVTSSICTLFISQVIPSFVIV